MVAAAVAVALLGLAAATGAEATTTAAKASHKRTYDGLYKRKVSKRNQRWAKRVARCESGGDPGAVSPDGQYRGKYQFDQQTWNSVGGSGDPAAAPEAEQDQRAAQLHAQRGSSPWPVCGG